MASLAELQTALVNADKAGDTAAATALAYEIKRISQPISLPQVSNPAANENATLQIGPINTPIPLPDWLNNTLAGIGKAGYDAARGVGELLGLVDRKDVDEANKLDAPLMATKAGKLGYFGGELGMALAPGGALKAAAQGAKMLPLLPRLLGAAGDAFIAPQTAAQGAVGGALLGATAPVGTDESRGLNAAVGALTGGVGTALANRLVKVLGPKAATLTPDQQALVAKALDMGYQLKPSEITGKTWQRNLEAAMAQHPATSGTMQGIAQANQGVTNSLVDDALARAGGEIDQPSAQAAALSGMNEGIAAEKARTGAAYRDLLGDTQVDLTQMRPALEALRAQQMALPADVRGGVGELDTLLGTPGYTKAAPAAFVRRPVDPRVDDMVTAIRKLGGLNPGDERIGSAFVTENPFNADPRLGPVWSSPIPGQRTTIGGGTRALSLDDMAEALHRLGYIPTRDSLDDVLENLADTTLGNPHYSTHFDYGASQTADDPLVGTLQELTQELRAKRAGPVQSPGYIRQNPTVTGEIAQDMRSDYGSASKSAFAARQNQAGKTLAGIKDAVDAAIAQAVPPEQAGQFAALNARYGLVKAVEKMAPSNQQTFLASLYRGDPDKFYTFLGLAPDANFQQVARGFLSNLVDKSTANGNVNAAKLGRTIAKANPEAMRVLGGDAGQTLADVGNIGQNVLREQVGNSGTAQRLLYNTLLSGGGLFGGAFGGEEIGDTPGAIGGALVGNMLMPRAVQAAYLSKALRPLLTRGVAGREALASPAVRAFIQRIGVAAPMAGLGLYATQ